MIQTEQYRCLANLETSLQQPLSPTRNEVSEMSTSPHVVTRKTLTIDDDVTNVLTFSDTLNNSEKLSNLIDTLPIGAGKNNSSLLNNKIWHM